MADLEVNYDTWSILLSLGIAFIGSFAAIALCEQYRLATLSSAQSKRYFVLFLVAASLGWACTWCVFCSSIATMKLTLNGSDIPVRCNRGMIIVVAFQQVIHVYIGLLIGASDPCFNNTKKEIMEKFIARTSNTCTLQQIRKLSKHRILFIVCTHSLERIYFAGVFGGIGVVISKFMVTSSISFQGDVQYNIGIVAASVLVAILNGTVAFWMFFRVLSVMPNLDSVRFLVTLLVVLTVCGMHFIGSSAVTFRFDENVSLPDESSTISQGDLYTTAVGSSVICVIIMLIFVMSDLRAWLFCTSTQLRQADKALNALMKRNEQLQKQLQLQQLQPAGAGAGTPSANTSIRPSTLHRTPSEVLKYSRHFQSSKSMPATAPSSANSLTTTSIKEVHSMFNDYGDEDEDDADDDDNDDGDNFERSISKSMDLGMSIRSSIKSSRKVTIHRSESFNNSGANAGHNLADLENQQQHGQLRVKPKQTSEGGGSSFQCSDSTVAIASAEVLESSPGCTNTTEVEVGASESAGVP